MNATTKRVLVMDDEDIVCRSYEKVLTKAGFEVEKAHTGREALDAARTHDYDVMLADLRMPGMSGLDVIRDLRATHPQMPVVVITGYPSQDTLREAAQLGVTDYLTKPVAPDVLTETTIQAITQRHWLDAGNRLAALQGTNAVRPPPQLAQAAPQPAEVLPVQVPAFETMPRAPAAEPAVAAEPAPPPRGFFRTLGALLWVPIVSVAYVIFLPLAGFAVFFGLGAKALARKLARKEV
jgi:CheY-like chemotaxis protein